MIVDDYDFFSIGVKTAVDEFIKKEKDKYQMYVPETGLGHFAIIKNCKNNSYKTSNFKYCDIKIQLFNSFII